MNGMITNMLGIGLRTVMNVVMRSAKPGMLRGGDKNRLITSREVRL